LVAELTGTDGHRALRRVDVQALLNLAQQAYSWRQVKVLVWRAAGRNALRTRDQSLMDTRYQIFISSTFKDLAKERSAVLSMVLGLNHIPAGMELFAAAASTPWTIIQRVIDLR
jgi:hypothetical protein